jgi:hypothetical protein
MLDGMLDRLHDVVIGHASRPGAGSTMFGETWRRG